MGVTTEPFWVNKASGTAPRNGTTSHTINFGFTSASGSYLILIIHGAVTNTISGWTELQAPISSGECSLFVKTSAGDSSVTVTHNGSNYPVNWIVYECAAGTAVTSSDSTTGGNDTMPGLTGLPGGSGNEQVIIGALGRVTVGGETTASLTVSAPDVEDLDVFTAQASGTDGSYLAVTHRLNVTTTTFTPTIAPSYTGSWGNATREKLVAAFNVVPPSSKTPVTGSLDLRWQVRSSVTGSVDLRWRVSNTVSSSMDLRWRVANTVSAGLDLRWQVRSAVTASLDLRWQTRAVASVDLDLRWRVANLASSPLDLRWRVANVVEAPLDLRWAVLAVVSAGLDLRWQVRSAVEAPLDLRWVVGDGVRSELQLLWASAGTVTSSTELLWQVCTQVSGALDLRWAVTSGMTAPLTLLWVIRSRASAPLQLLWVVEGSGIPIPTRIKARLLGRASANLTPTRVIADFRS